MAALPSCPDPARLRKFLLGQFSDLESADLEKHLPTCKVCLEVARSLQTDDCFIKSLRRGADIAQVPLSEAVENLLCHLMGSLEAGREHAGHDVPAENAVADPRSSDTPYPRASPSDSDLPKRGQESFDFLAPPTRPDELGWLGLYRVLSVLGAGGMGIVFQAEDPQLQRLVAIKVMRPALAANATARQRFLREARAAAAIEHDHIVPIYRVRAYGDVPFLVMPLLKGESLEQRLQRQGRLSPAETLRIGREIGEGLAAAHAQGLVHRDIKPANIWLESGRDRVKILDFGLAGAIADAGPSSADTGDGEAEKSAEEESPPLTGRRGMLGTPGFMAPEQVAGAAVDGRSDLFSLGCVLYQMSTGELPFTGGDAASRLAAVTHFEPSAPCHLDPGLSPAFSNLVMRLLAKDPADRPESAQAVIAELEALKIGPPTAGIRQPAVAERVEKPMGRARKRRWRSPFLLLTVLLVLGPALVATVLWLRPLDEVLHTASPLLCMVVLEIDDTEVETVLSKAELVLHERVSGVEYRLHLGSHGVLPGDYEVQVKGETDELRIEPKSFILGLGDQRIVRVSLAHQNKAVAKGKVREVRRLRWEGVRLDGVAISPDGRSLLAFLMGSASPRSRLCDLEAGTFRELPAGLARLTPDESRIVGITKQGIRVFDARSGTELRTFGSLPKGVWNWSFALSPDGKTALTAASDWHFRLWDLETEKELKSWSYLGTAGRWAWSAEGKYLFLQIGAPQRWMAWDIAAGKETDAFAHLGNLEGGLLFLPGGKEVMSFPTINNVDVVTLLDLKTGKKLSEVPQPWPPEFGPDVAVGNAPNGRRRLYFYREGHARLIDLRTGMELDRFSVPWGVVIYGVSISADGRHAAGASRDGEIVVWRLPDWTPPAK